MRTLKPLALAVIAAMSSPAFAAQNSADVDQSGVSLQATVTQTGGIDNTTSITQGGASNEAISFQQAGIGDSINQYQQGSANYSEARQSDYTVAGLASGNMILQHQAVGSENVANATQTNSTGSVISQGQHGSSNSAEGTQSDSVGAELYQLQVGDGNSATANHRSKKRNPPANSTVARTSATPSKTMP